MSTHNPEILKLAKKAKLDGTSVDEFRKIVFDAMPGHTRIENPDPHLGVPEKDLKKYSFVRAITKFAEGKFDGLERELSDEFTKVAGKAPSSFWVPQDVLTYSPRQNLQRDLLKGTASLGGNLVATEFLAGSFI